MGQNIFVKIIKVLGYIIAAIVLLWAAKEVFVTTPDKAQKGDNVEYIENRIP